WKQVLGLEQVGIHDNFFALGGDSILSIQIVARAQQAGLRFGPDDLFQHRTIAQLVTVISARERHAAEQGPTTGLVPLTPIQRWFFEQQPAQPAHFSQSLLLESRRPLDVAPLTQALQQVVQHHEALGLRFVHSEHGWEQINAGETAPVSCRQVDLAALPRFEQRAALEQVAAEAQASLDLEAGPLVRAVLFDLGADQPQRLLLVIHQLVVDRASWRILLDDLQSAYSQLMHGTTIALRPQTTAFQRWAEQLSTYAQSEAARAELSYWRQVIDRPRPTLPLDEPSGANSVASASEITRSLTADETRSLLQDVPPVYHTQVDEVLLAALAQGFAAWTGQTTLLLDLEGDGRGESLPGVDLSRTIGWLTSIFPVALELPPAADPGAALRAVKEQLRRVPRRGVGYGVLRYLSQDGQIAEQLGSGPGAQISFSYGGQTEPLPASSTFDIVSEMRGPNVDPQAQRPYLLEISAIVGGGQLRLQWRYGEQIHRRAAIEGFAEHCMAALRAIINHCLAPEAGGFTPSDFPAARVNQKELDKLFGMIGKKGGPSRR
ncbi:MAG TPA: condensation domain-containing protein, partial [Herpetosiphonaceae bacterium]